MVNILFSHFIDLWFHCHHRCIVIDVTARVRPPPHFSISVNEALMKPSRIAIWNKDKVVVAIATGVWVTNIAFMIQGNGLTAPAPSSLGL